LRPNTPRLSGRSVFCSPPGIGKLRCSTTVSEIALAAKNQLGLVRKPGVRQRGMPAWRRRSCSSGVEMQIGRSPFSVFWLYGSHQRSRTMPSASISRQRSGIGI
jgi:hypothetical protein